MNQKVKVTLQSICGLFGVLIPDTDNSQYQIKV